MDHQEPSADVEMEQKDSPTEEVQPMVTDKLEDDQVDQSKPEEDDQEDDDHYASILDDDISESVPDNANSENIQNTESSESNVNEESPGTAEDGEKCDNTETKESADVEDIVEASGDLSAEAESKLEPAAGADTDSCKDIETSNLEEQTECTETKDRSEQGESEVKETKSVNPDGEVTSDPIPEEKENKNSKPSEEENQSCSSEAKENENSRSEPSSQLQAESSGGSAEDSIGPIEPDSSSLLPEGVSEKDIDIPDTPVDTYEDSLTELKMIFGNQNKKDTEPSSSKSNKNSYENQFEKFLQKGSEKCHSDVEDSNNDSENTNRSKEDLKPSNVNFKVISEETSNSSWYKIGSNSEQSMDISGPGNQEDISNMSAPDNASVVSSNIGDSCMSFQDQGSNMDECSNLSVPEDSVTVEQYTGHAPDFDESANMNPPSNVTFIRPDTPSSVTADATSESTPAKRSRRGTLQVAVDDAIEHGHNLTAANIYEYHWPSKDKDPDLYILQEQISIFLDIKSFKRKYPDLFRRVCDKHEKDFLREKGVVSVTQSDLGLTALKSDEVHDLMSRDYPAKYKELLKVIHERERQKMAIKMKEHDALKLEKDRLLLYTKRAMKSASEWNRNMLKERNQERRAYFDMQTFTIQYPKSKFRKMEQVKSDVTGYPLSLIPGQFQDYYRKYNSEELKYFPINTTLFDPPKKVDLLTRQRQLQQMEEETESQDDRRTGTGSVSSSDSDDDSSSSSSDESDSKESTPKPTKRPPGRPPLHAQPSNGTPNIGRPPSNGRPTGSPAMKPSSSVKKKEKSSSREASKEKSVETLSSSLSSLQPVVKLEIMECRICKQDKVKHKNRIEEEMIRCSECKSTGHPSCLDLTDDMVKIIKTYPWQCMECKTCVQCMDPYDEDKMLFCDKCDRGYHTFCVGLRSLPTGSWECKSCSGDSTPITPIPKPRRGRPPKHLSMNAEDTPGKDKAAKDSPARDRPVRTPTGKDTPTREQRTITRDVKDSKYAIRERIVRPASRDAVRLPSRESSRSSIKDEN